MQTHKNRKLLRGNPFKRSLITNFQLLMTAALTGCMGVYEGGFECPPGKGVGCKSISEVNGIVEQAAVIGDQKGSSFGEKGAACNNGFGSCSSLEIWYAPTFEVNPKEKTDSQNKCKAKVFDDALSI